MALIEQTLRKPLPVSHGVELDNWWDIARSWLNKAGGRAGGRRAPTVGKATWAKSMYFPC